MKKQPRTDVVTITTDYGSIDLILYDQTPKHKANFLKLAQEGYYNGTTFHRIIKGFMIQGGDPNSKNADPNDDGMGGPNYTIPAEFVPGLVHDQGALAAARNGDNVNPQKASSGSQFYIVDGAQGAHFLDGNYTVFGKVIRGIETVQKIADQQKNPMDRPLKDIKMNVTVKGYSAKQLKETFNYATPVAAAEAKPAAPVKLRDQPAAPRNQAPATAQ